MLAQHIMLDEEEVSKKKKMRKSHHPRVSALNGTCPEWNVGEWRVMESGCPDFALRLPIGWLIQRSDRLASSAPIGWLPALRLAGFQCSDWP